MNIEIKKMPWVRDIELPKFQTEGSAAVDLCSAEEIFIDSGENQLIHTGICVHIGDNSCVGIIAPRSGLATKQGITLTNSIGVIDSDYQGELKVCLTNNSPIDFHVKPGMRIAQLMFLSLCPVNFVEVDEFSTKTERGVKGFGSTGV